MEHTLGEEVAFIVTWMLVYAMVVRFTVALFRIKVDWGEYMAFVAAPVIMVPAHLCNCVVHVIVIQFVLAIAYYMVF